MLISSRRTGPTLVSGSGAYVTDTEGKNYLDFVGGIGAVGLGHCHPDIVRVIGEQSRKLIGTGLYYSDALLELSEKIAAIVPAPLKKSFFVNSGTEASEGAVKLAMKYAFTKGREGYGVISLMRSFHGRLGVTSAITGRSDYKRGLAGFSTFPNAVHSPAPYCYRCPFKLKFPGCEVACAEFLEEIALCGLPGGAVAFMYEPILGVGGVIVPPDEYHTMIQKFCSKHDLLLIADEIFTGFGRTGKMFACEHWGMKPDIMSVAKVLGGVGMPIGAFIASEEVARAFDPSDHFSTFGGNPLSCKVASATIDLLTKNKIPENAEKIGNYIMEGLRELMSRFEIVGDVRGKGLLIGVELVKDKGSRAPAPQEAKKLVDEIRKKGVLMAATGIYGCTIRLSPPLIITEEDASKFLSLFKDSLKEVSG